MCSSYCYRYEGEDLEKEIAPTLQDGQRIIIPVTHDETCVHAGELPKYEWMREGEQPLRSKNEGRIIHISGFALEKSGHLRLSDAEIAEQEKLPKAPPVSNPGSQSVNLSTSRTRRTQPQPDPNARLTSHALNFTRPDPSNPHRLPAYDANVIIHPGAAGDPWWDMPQLIDQVKHRAIPIFEYKFPGAQALFIFDCSSAHEAFASDALIAHKMNRGPGGRQPRMHDTINPRTGEVQHMVFPDDFTGTDKDGKSLAGQAKGMEEVLRERKIIDDRCRLVENGKQIMGVCTECKKSAAARDKAAKEAKARRDEAEGSGLPMLAGRNECDEEAQDRDRPKDCCMMRILSLEPDFKAEKPLLQVLIEAAGHKCVFLPKFHCELNPIEMVWGQLKQGQFVSSFWTANDSTD